MNGNDEYLTTNEVAKILRVNVKTVLGYVRRGILPHKKSSPRLILICRKDVEKFDRMRPETYSDRMSGDPYNDYLTTRDAAKIIGVSVPTIRYYVYHGHLPCKMPSERLMLIPRKAVVNFVRPPRGRPRTRERRQKT